jgi:hypothetical protein
MIILVLDRFIVDETVQYEISIPMPINKAGNKMSFFFTVSKKLKLHYDHVDGVRLRLRPAGTNEFTVHPSGAI